VGRSSAASARQSSSLQGTGGGSGFELRSASVFSHSIGLTFSHYLNLLCTGTWLRISPFWRASKDELEET
jgi:hypothetical protein